MKKKLLGLVTVLCMVLFLVPVQMFSAATPADVTIDVGMENTENDDYKVMDNAINIRKDGIVYELTGTTDRKIQMWGSNALNADGPFGCGLCQGNVPCQKGVPKGLDDYDGQDSSGNAAN